MSAATYIGINEILEGFDDKASKPYFSIWVDNTQVEYNCENDFEKAKNKIIKQIEAFARSGMTKIIYLKIHPKLPEKKEGIYTKTDPALTMYCAAKQEYKNVIGYSGDNSIYPIYQLIEKQNETINALVSKINAIEAEEEENESVGSNEEIILDKINGIINSPLGVLASTYLPRLLDKFIPPSQKIAGIAGHSETDLETTINILFEKGVTLQHLQKLAAMPKEKIQMLITML
jgi:hypothetical protein